MIKLCRVDHRLLHGQVAFSWVNSLQADCILVANDDVANDEIWKTTIKLAKPAGVKLVIKNIADSIDAINSGVTDKYKLLIIIRTIEDAHKLLDNCDRISELNLGGTKKIDEMKQIGKAIFINDKDETLLKELISKGKKVIIQQLASENGVDVSTIL